MIVVDASVWVSRLVPEDVHHIASQRWLESVFASGRPVAAPMLLLAEVSGAIARRTGQPALGHKAYNSLLSIPNMRLVRTDKRLGLQAAQIAADWRLRGADSVYAAVAHYLDIPLVSWDQEQLQRVADLVRVYMPDVDGWR